MRTVVETPTFQIQASEIWSENERLDFITWISKNSLAGDVVPGAEGARKVRWSLQSKGKRGGVRVIYFNLSAQGVVYLVAIYKKSERENVNAHDLKKEL